jgi:low affinity Fe/Cu permease
MIPPRDRGVRDVVLPVTGHREVAADHFATRGGKKPMSHSSTFTRFAKAAAHFTGQPRCFVLAALVIVVWALTGPIFKFNNTWQLVINTGTTIVTFLMVFLIQNTQNRDTEALQIKLDELIRSIEPASNTLLALEELDDDVLEKQRKRFADLAKEARAAEEQRESEEGGNNTQS